MPRGEVRQKIQDRGNTKAKHQNVEARTFAASRRDFCLETRITAADI